MNKKEIENFIKMIDDNAILHEDNQSKINNILISCEYSTKKDREFAKKIQDCVKYFYKKPLKHQFGEDISYVYEISKRGIGTKYKSSHNMDLITSFLDTPTRWTGNSKNIKSFKTILDNKTYYEGLKNEITEEGQEFFNQIKKLIQKYNLIDVSKTTQKKIKLPLYLQKYVGASRTEFEITFNDSQLKISYNQPLKTALTGGYHYSMPKEIFNNREKNENLEIKILQVYLKEEINEAIEEANEYVKPHLKEWKGFEIEFNQLVAKYVMLAAI